MSQTLQITGKILLPIDDAGAQAAMDLAMSFAYTQKVHDELVYAGAVSNEPVSLGSMASAKVLILKCTLGSCSVVINGGANNPILLDASSGYFIWVNTAETGISSLNVTAPGPASLKIIALSDSSGTAAKPAVGYLPVYSTATRPQASAVPDGVIINSDEGSLNISDGTKWTTLNVPITDFQVYVDTTGGSDNNPGTPQAPLKTLDAAFSKLPAAWTGKCRVNLLTAGTYALPLGKSYSFGAGVGPSAEPLLIQGVMQTASTRNVTGVNGAVNDSLVVDGPAMTVNQYRGYIVSGFIGAVPAWAMVISNGANTLTFSSPVDFTIGGAVQIQSPACHITIGNTPSGTISVWSGGPVELFNVSVEPTDWIIRDLSIYAWNSWIGAPDASGRTILIEHGELSAKPSGLVSSLAAIAGQSETGGVGAGLFLRNNAVTFANGSVSKPGYWVSDATVVGSAQPFLVDYGSATDLGYASFFYYYVQVNHGSLLSIEVLESTTQCKFDNNQTAPAFVVGGGSTAHLATIDISNCADGIWCYERSVVTLGNGPAGTNAAAPSTSGVKNGQYGVNLFSLGSVVLKDPTAQDPSGGPVLTMLTGTTGDVNVDGVVKTWAQVQAAPIVNNGSMTAYNQTI